MLLIISYACILRHCLHSIGGNRKKFIAQNQPLNKRYYAGYCSLARMGQCNLVLLAR